MARPTDRRGFTLIELMVTVAIAALILVLAAPSFENMIVVQRLRGVSAQLMTDLQFARSEAVAKSRYMIVTLGANATQSCYVVYYTPAEIDYNQCDCTKGAGSACTLAGGLPIPGHTEVKTVSVPRSGKVELAWPETQDTTFAFDPVTGGLMSYPSDRRIRPIPILIIDAKADEIRRLTTEVKQTGRPRVCGSSAANVQSLQVPAC